MSDDVALRVAPDSPLIPNILQLVQSAFAYMEDRIDPPSSMHKLDQPAIQEQCRKGEVWSLGSAPDACIFLKEKNDALYVGKLAVRLDKRGQGLARKLMDLAEERARDKGLHALELETRLELTENHETFGRLGFEKTAEGRHEGYDRATFIIMRKAI
jgi:GNAT superfamily N-acetyltransferase